MFARWLQRSSNSNMSVTCTPLLYRMFHCNSRLFYARKKSKNVLNDDGGGSGGRRSAFDAAVKQIQMQFGKGAVMRMGDTNASLSSGVSVIPTGSLSLDLALGVGGLPRGRVVEIFGPEATGKTTLALHVIAQAQKMTPEETPPQGDGEIQCAFIDAEHALDASYAKKLGVNMDNLWIAQPDNGEQALEIADTMVRSGGVDVLVVDSVAALVPRAEVEGEMGDAHMALQARLMSQALRKLTSHLSRSNTLLIFINQLRSKVGVIFGSPEVTAGGNALKFYSSIRLDIRRTGPVKTADTVVGNSVRVKVAKNKLAPPFHLAEFDLIFGQGISREGELVTLGVKHGVIKKSGAWFSFEDRQIGQGKDKCRVVLENDPSLAAAIEEQIRKVAKPEYDDDAERNEQESSDDDAEPV